jgi:hypothetical protein
VTDDWPPLLPRERRNAEREQAQERVIAAARAWSELWHGPEDEAVRVTRAAHSIATELYDALAALDRLSEPKP